METNYQYLMAYLKYFTFILVLDFIRLNGISCSYRILKTSTNQKRLYVFGDSLFDAGNQQYLPNDKDYVASIHFPYGFTYFTNATGRYCDGRIVPDFLSEFANLGLISPSMKPGADFSNGANFASAGAYALDTGGDIEALNLGDQLNNFTYMVTNMKEAIGDAESKKILMEAVYIFSIGGIDYASFYENYYNNGTLPTQTEQETFVETVVGNISARLLEIYREGGRKFAFQNVGPIGCTPTIKSTYPELKGQCAELLLKLAKMHNRLLSETLSYMAQNLKGFKYSIFDYYSSLLDRIDNPRKYGVTNAKIACCGFVDDPYRGDGCAKVNFTICQYPSIYLFFDGTHTAQYSNYQISQLMWNGIEPMIQPNNLRQFFEEDSIEDSIL